MQHIPVRRYDPNDSQPTTNFHYQELDPDIPSTRLILLLSAQKTLEEHHGWTGFVKQVIRTPKPVYLQTIPRIRCELDVTYIGSSRKIYDAVSYTWESSPRDRAIELSGGRFNISRVVEDLLLRLRDEHEDRLLWIDQMCINQDDPVEKSSQVKRMKDIFEGARRVIVSLGPHGARVVEEDDLEFRSIPIGSGKVSEKKQVRLRQSVASSSVESRVSVTQETKLQPEKFWKAGFFSRRGSSRRGDLNLQIKSVNEQALNAFCHNPSIGSIKLSGSDKVLQLDVLVQCSVFDRAWIVQEIAAAKSILVVCGGSEVDGRHFERLYTQVLPQLEHPRDPISERLRRRLEQLRPLLRFMWRRDDEIESLPELHLLLQQFRLWQASLPYDKVYALLRLSADGQVAVTPEYHKPIGEVFLDVTEYMLNRYRSLDVLAHSGYGWGEASVTHVPSWCVDWSMSTHLLDPLKGLSPCSLESRIRLPFRVNEGMILVLWGIALARIQAVLDHGIDVSIPQQLRAGIDNLAITCDALSEHLQRIASWLKRFECDLRKHDRIYWLYGSTGIAILRPISGKRSHTLVFMDHSKYDIFDTADSFPKRQDLFEIDLERSSQAAEVVTIR